MDPGAIFSCINLKPAPRKKRPASAKQRSVLNIPFPAKKRPVSAGRREVTIEFHCVMLYCAPCAAL